MPTQPKLMFLPLLPKDEAALLHFLIRDEWPFHCNARPTKTLVQEWFSDGRFHGPDAWPFWICLGDARVGVINIEDIESPNPTFDLRIQRTFRRRGIGLAALKWLAAHLFTQTDKHRVEGHTRVDNRGMRATFRAAGWVQEAHHRASWPDEHGNYFDGVTYAILKSDWETGQRTPSTLLDGE